MSPEHPANDDLQQQSPLFTLPRELRDLIYRFTLTKGSPIAPQRNSHRNEERTTVLPVFQTCRRIGQESTKLYFSTNTFRFFDDGELDEIELPLFFRSLPPEKLKLCTCVSLEASLGPQRGGRCFREYCVGSVEVDLSAMTARTSGRTNCCEQVAEELGLARERVQAVLLLGASGGGIQGLGCNGRAALGRRVGREFCQGFECLHPDHGE